MGGEDHGRCTAPAPCPGQNARIDPDALLEALSGHLRAWLPAQPWYAGGAPGAVVPVEVETLRREWPVLASVPVEVLGGEERATYHLLVGLAQEPPADLPAQAVIGEVPTPDGTAVAYDGLRDPVTARALVAEVAPDLAVRSARHDGDDAAATRVVLDDRWALTVYRRLHDGPNPDVELSVALGREGSKVVAAPVAVWRRHAWDLAVVRPSTVGAERGDALFRASVDEVLATRQPPSRCRLDVDAPAEALGRAVATFHVESAAALGAQPVDASVLVEELVARLRAVGPAGDARDRVEASYRRAVHGTDLGWSIRVHGDLRLDDLRWARKAWTIVDLGVDPRLDVGLRRTPTSPLRDVATVLWDVQRTAAAALDAAVAPVGSGEAAAADEGSDGPSPIDPPERELAVLAESWEDRATDSFLRGYTSVDAVHRLLPVEGLSRDALLTVFELDRAVHEVAVDVDVNPDLDDGGLDGGDRPAPLRPVRPGRRRRW